MMGQALIWWQGRSERERWMLGVMAVLFALVLLAFGVIRPIEDARLTAVARLDTATLDAGRITSVTRAMTVARQMAPRALAIPLPDAVSASASTSGFSLARIDQSGPDRVTIAITNVRSTAFFAWIDALERRGIVVERMNLRTNSDATLGVDGMLRVQGR